ncbi:MAG: sugar kinase [Hyphomicrobiaceae bacterium]
MSRSRGEINRDMLFALGQTDVSIVAVGECMIELARGIDGRFALAFGGDTFNTAVYAARLGANVKYLTAVGDDPFSMQIVALAHSEGVGGDAILHVPERLPGLYLIETQQGERTFYYWRQSSPARQLFDSELAPRALESLAEAECIYLSGITLSLYDDKALDKFADAIIAARQRGAVVAMDSNFRPQGWRSDIMRAREVFRRFWSLATLALPTFEDEQMLWGDTTPQQTLDRIRQCGPPEVCIKAGGDGAYVVSEECAIEHVACPEIVDPVDTTAAGDSFNAAYLVSRLGGRPPCSAAEFGHRLAAIVIMHRGALAPTAAMQDLCADFTESLVP